MGVGDVQPAQVSQATPASPHHGPEGQEGFLSKPCRVSLESGVWPWTDSPPQRGHSSNSCYGFPLTTFGYCEPFLMENRANCWDMFLSEPTGGQGPPASRRLTLWPVGRS